MIQLLLVSAILALCSLVQSAVGFAFNLLALPLLLSIGLSLPEAVLLATLGASFQKIHAVLALRRSIIWHACLLLLVTSAVTLPAGILVLRGLARVDPRWIRAGVGGFVLVALAAVWALRVTPRERLHWGWGVLAGSVSGFLSGLTSTGGPPIVLYVHAHRWRNPQMRATMLAQALALAPLQLSAYFGAFGRELYPAARLGLYSLPAVLLGTWLGLALGHALSETVLRRVTYAILVVLSLSLLRPLGWG